MSSTFDSQKQQSYRVVLFIAPTMNSTNRHELRTHFEDSRVSTEKVLQYRAVTPMPQGFCCIVLKRVKSLQHRAVTLMLQGLHSAEGTAAWYRPTDCSGETEKLQKNCQAPRCERHKCRCCFHSDNCHARTIYVSRHHGDTVVSI